MAHKTLIDGTEYSVTGGKTLVDGTEYSIKSGKTSINSTIYDVFFASQIYTIEYDMSALWGSSYATILVNEEYYQDSFTIEVNGEYHLYFNPGGANRYITVILDGVTIADADQWGSPYLSLKSNAKIVITEGDYPSDSAVYTITTY